MHQPSLRLQFLMNLPGGSMRPSAVTSRFISAAMQILKVRAAGSRQKKSSPIWDIDLRQESHGFLNHAAVSWHGPQNAANRGLAATEVEQDETARLQRALGHVVQALPMGRYDEEHIKDSFDEPVQSWSTERELARRAGLGYKRFAATDMEWPAPAVIDDFVDFYRSLPKNHGWLFFHCQAGQGRR